MNQIKTFLLPENQKRQGEGGLRMKDNFKYSSKNKPLISIVTVVFNGDKHLEETILSVINQTYDNVEYIIIDGGSTDGTLDIIKKYEDRIDYWVSEEDGGISDAFNKGIKCASGDIIGLINADDWYEVDALSCIARTFSANPDCGIFCGSMQLHTEGRSRILHSKPHFLWFGMTIVHPSTFIKAEIYHSFGLFDIALKYAMDYDLLLRFYTASVRFCECNHRVFSNMRSGGVANSNRIEAYSEVMAIAKHYNFYIVIYTMYSIRKIVWSVKRVFKSYFVDKEPKC